MRIAEEMHRRVRNYPGLFSLMGIRRYTLSLAGKLSVDDLQLSTKYQPK